MEEKKLGFIQRLVIAVAKPKEYWRTVVQGGGKVIKFLAILLVITTFCGFPLDYIKASIGTNGFKDIVEEYVPEFQFANGRLEMDEPYELDKEGVYIYIDTAYSSFSYDDLQQYIETGDYDEVILAGADGAVLYNDGEYQEGCFANLDGITFDKSSVMGLLKSVHIVAVIAIIFLYIGILLKYLFMSMIYALLGMILKNALGIHSEVTFGQIYIMAISAKVTMRIVLAITKLFDFNIPFFNGICLVVTLVYLYLGLAGIKEKRQLELDAGRTKEEL